MAKAFTLIYYVVPQDQDDTETPNAFGIGKAIDQVTLKDVKQSFPLSGEYIFRSRYKTHSHTVWLDLPQENTPIPQYQNRIFIKATRISWEQPNQPAPQPQPQPVPVPQQVIQQTNLFEFQRPQGGPPSVPSEPAQPQPVMQQPNLFEF